MDDVILRNLKMHGNDLCSSFIDHVTRDFIDVMMKFIAKYPLVWKNFVENILKNPIATRYEGCVVIIFTQFLPQYMQYNVAHTIEYVKRSGIIKEVKTVGGDEYYLEFNSQYEFDFFYKTGQWLEFFTYYTIQQVSIDLSQDINISQGTIIRLGSKRIQQIKELDVMGLFNGHYFVVECKDTNTYDYRDIDRLKLIAHKLHKGKVKKIFVTTKLKRQVASYAKAHAVDVVHFEGDYMKFKQDLKDVMTGKELDAKYEEC